MSKMVIFDLPAFSVVYTLVKKIYSCQSCDDKCGKSCFHSVLLRVLESLDNSVFFMKKKRVIKMDCLKCPYVPSIERCDFCPYIEYNDNVVDFNVPF